MVGVEPAPVLRGLFATARACRGAANWVPGEALPTAERPMRLAEFDELFRSVREVDRMGPTRLRLILNETGGVADQAQDLIARESECCSFFEFDVSSDDSRVVVDVGVPDSRAVALDGLAAHAKAAQAGSTQPAGAKDIVMRSGELAAPASVNVKTLRYHERRGLLPEPQRSMGGYREYDDEAVGLLRVVKAAQRLGFTLDEVAELLDTGRRRRHPSPGSAGPRPGEDR